MAKPQSAEPKTPLIVATVFFVLATLALGVLYYLETDKKTQAVADAKKAGDDKAAADKLRAEEQDKVKMYRAALGVAEAGELDELKSGRNDAKVKEEFDKLRSALEARVKALTEKRAALLVGQGNRSLAPKANDLLSWSALAAGKADKEPELTVADAVVTALARQLLAAGQLDTAQRDLQESTKRFQEQAAATEAERKNLQTKIEEVTKQAAADIAKRDDELGKIRGSFAERTNEYTKAQTTSAENLTARGIELEAAKQKNAGQSKQLERLEDKADAQEDPFRFQKPVGRVVRRERGGGTVYIDIGSADNVPVGLRFSVMPSNTPEVGMTSRLRPRLTPSGRPLKESNGQPAYDVVPKGRLEVVSVDGPNLSTCRLTFEADAVRERVEVGDLLYNASWRRGKTDTIALYGVFDTNADGSDDIQTVISDLRKMNITVAAYFDLDQRKWVDPTTRRPTAITEQVVYAVEGAYPASRAGDALAAARSELIKALDDAKQQAKDRGVKLVKARTYLPQIGFDYRGGDAPPDRVSQAFNRYLRTAPAGDAPPPAAPEGK